MKPAPPAELVDCGPALTEEGLAGIEHFLGMRLPVEYRAFLLRYNGGKPLKTEFPVKSHAEGNIDLELFFGVTRAKEADNLEWNYRTHRQTLGKNLLPIGRTPANDLLALGLAGEQRDCVVFYDVIEEDPKARMHDVADSFVAFMASLTEG